MNKIALITLLTTVCCKAVLAQTCPASIEAVSRVKGNFPDWRVNEPSRTSVLIGITIADVYVNDAGKKEDAELRPMEGKAGLLYWRFRQEVGKNEVIMRCGYADTQITLSMRVDADVVECFEQTISDNKSQKKGQTVAMCVNTLQKSQVVAK